MQTPSNPGCQTCGTNFFQSVENFAPDQSLQNDAISMSVDNAQSLMSKLSAAVTPAPCAATKGVDLSHQVLTMIMHDIKSPLSTIQLCLEIIDALSQVSGEDDPVRRALTRAQANIERVQMLADDVLMQEKVKSGTLELKTKALSLEAVIRDCLETLTALARVQNIEIKVTDVQTVVIADRIRLSQILQNLICNAISFSPPGSTVSIKSSRRKIEEKEYLVISVTDNGPGIPESIRAEIFKAFHQLPNGIERAGTYGLGLAICQTLVALHNGKVWVEANAGRGCTFQVALPCI